MNYCTKVKYFRKKNPQKTLEIISMQYCNFFQSTHILIIKNQVDSPSSHWSITKSIRTCFFMENDASISFAAGKISYVKPL